MSPSVAILCISVHCSWALFIASLNPIRFSLHYWYRIVFSSDSFPCVIAPAFSTHTIYSRMFHSCTFHYRIFSPPPLTSKCAICHNFYATPKNSSLHMPVGIVRAVRTAVIAFAYMTLCISFSIIIMIIHYYCKILIHSFNSSICWQYFPCEKNYVKVRRKVPLFGDKPIITLTANGSPRIDRCNGPSSVTHRIKQNYRVFNL